MMTNFIEQIEFEINTVWVDTLEKSKACLKDPIFWKDGVNKIISQFMPECPTEQVEKLILQAICPPLNAEIVKIIEDVEKRLENPEFRRDLEETTFDEQFLEIRNLLACWHEILDQVVQLNNAPFPPHVVKSVLDVLPITLLTILSHCKNKRKQYLHNMLPLVLQDVYRDACAVVKRFGIFTLKVLHYDLKTDVEALQNVIINLGKMAPLTVHSIKYVMNTWDTFQKLVCKSTLNLWTNEEFIDLVRSHIPEIQKNILTVQSTTMGPPFEQYKTRVEQTDAFHKILKQLVDVYCSKSCPKPLDAQSVRQMLDFIILSTAYHELTRSNQAHCDLASNVLIDWIPPIQLINYCKESEHFITEFTAVKEQVKTSEDLNYKIGFHICILDVESLPDQSNLQVAIENLNNIQEELLRGKILKKWKNKAKIEYVPIYNYTFHTLSQLLNAKTFHTYEPILLEYVFADNFWPAMMCYDLLNYCYLRSTKEMRFNHMRIFMTAYEKLENRCDNSIAVMMLCRLIINLYLTLTPAEEDELLKDCTASFSILSIFKLATWYDPREELWDRYKRLVSPEAPRCLPKIIADLRRSPTVNNWTRLVSVLTAMGIEKTRENIDMTADLLKIANFVGNALEKVEDFKSRLLYDLLLALFDCARVECRSSEEYSFNWILLTVLVKLVVQNSLPCEILVEMCHYLANNVQYLANESYSSSEISVVSDLLCRLLENDSNVVHQEALETFDRIVESANENLVKDISCSIRNRPKICDGVQAYISGKVFHRMKEDLTYMEIFAKYSSKFSVQHKCYKSEERWRDEKMPRLTEESVDEKALRLSSELKTLVCMKKDMNASVMKKLSVACYSFIE